jgi:hypothetical protein
MNTNVAGSDRGVRCTVVVNGLALGLAPVGPRFVWMNTGAFDGDRR